jgi:hypothetical protein
VLNPHQQIAIRIGAEKSVPLQGARMRINPHWALWMAGLHILKLHHNQEIVHDAFPVSGGLARAP